MFDFGRAPGKRRRKKAPRKRPPTKKEFSHRHLVRDRRTGKFVKRRHTHRVGKEEFPHGW